MASQLIGSNLHVVIFAIVLQLAATASTFQSGAVLRREHSENGDSDAICAGGVNTFMASVRQRSAPTDWEVGTDDAEYTEEQKMIAEVGAKTVCETGFNAGVSSLAWLCSSRDVRVHSFDIGQHMYVYTARDYLTEVFGKERLTLTIGDSNKTLPALIKAKTLTCDISFVDGGHTFDIAFADIKNFRLLTKASGRLLVENCNVEGKANGFGGIPSVNRAYQEAIKQGMVKHERQMSTAGCGGWDLQKCREICVGHYL